jgi:DNA-directed RNA polymerase specialized sigma24 family protein
MIRGYSGGEHPWKNLEADFRRLKEFHVQGRDENPAERQQAYVRIGKMVDATAERMLIRSGVRNPYIEKHDVTQNFFIAVLSGGLARCDGRPIHVFCYVILKYLCFAAWRKSAKVRFLPEHFEQEDNQPGPLDALLLEEVRDVVSEILDALSAPRRATVENWMLRKATQGRPRNIDQAESRRESSRFYHARLRVAKRFPHYRNIVEE